MFPCFCMKPVCETKKILDRESVVLLWSAERAFFYFFQNENIWDLGHRGDFAARERERESLSVWGRKTGTTTQTQTIHVLLFFFVFSIFYLFLEANQFFSMLSRLVPDLTPSAWQALPKRFFFLLLLLSRVGKFVRLVCVCVCVWTKRKKIEN